MSDTEQTESYERRKQVFLENINSWDDLYRFFDAGVARVRDTMHPGFVFDCLFTLYAFVQALRELPEEGDVKVIAERLLYIMSFESQEKLGAQLQFVEMTDAMTSAERMHETLAFLAQTAPDPGEPIH